jgi:hypothetical protein
MNMISDENEELGGMCGMWLGPVLRYHPDIFLHNLRKTRKISAT